MDSLMDGLSTGVDTSEGMYAVIDLLEQRNKELQAIKAEQDAKKAKRKRKKDAVESCESEVKKPAAANPYIDTDANYMALAVAILAPDVVEKDKDGNPIMEEVKDANGNPVLEEVKDENGNPVKGIDNKLVSNLKKDKVKLESDIAKIEKAKEKAAIDETKLEELNNQQSSFTEDSKEYRQLQKKIDMVKYDLLVQQRVIENEAIFNMQLKKLEDDIEYFSNNEVTIYQDKHIPKSEIDRRIKEAAAILDIEQLLDRLPGKMRGGQRQRVALGRAIVRTPKLFLLDEPLSNLDAKLRAQMRVEITKLFDKLDTSFIYVTHDQVEALTMGTRIVVLNAGWIQQVDTPTRLYDFPKNRFVAGFLGTPQMNFYEVNIQKIKDKLHIEMCANNAFDIPLKEMRKIEEEYLDGEVHSAILGIRSENISIDPKGEFEVKVSITESLGSDTLIYSDFELDKEIDIRESLSSIVIKVPGRVDNIERNSKIRINFDKTKIHLFRNDNDKEDSILGETIGQ